MSVEILVGTSGYAFDDWTGPFYPPRLPAREKLRFYAARFPALELNSTFYRLPTAEWLADVADRLPPGYPVVVKAFQGLTHDRTAPDPLPAFRDACGALAARGMLAGVLLQFPQRVHNDAEARARLVALLDGLRGLTPIVEFRHRGWDADTVRALLADHGAAWCCVDAPPLPDLLPPVVAATADVGVIRFHGRNAATWYGGDGPLRYDWAYSDAELSGWLPGIRDLAGKVRRLFLFFNNCHRAQSVAAARRMGALLAESGLAPPLPEPAPGPRQGELF